MASWWLNESNRPLATPHIQQTTLHSSLRIHFCQLTILNTYKILMIFKPSVCLLFLTWLCCQRCYLKITHKTQPPFLFQHTLTTPVNFDTLQFISPLAVKQVMHCYKTFDYFFLPYIFCWTKTELNCILLLLLCLLLM